MSACCTTRLPLYELGMGTRVVETIPLALRPMPPATARVMSWCENAAPPALFALTHGRYCARAILVRASAWSTSSTAILRSVERARRYSTPSCHDERTRLGAGAGASIGSLTGGGGGI